MCFALSQACVYVPAVLLLNLSLSLALSRSVCGVCVYVHCLIQHVVDASMRKTLVKCSQAQCTHQNCTIDCFGVLGSVRGGGGSQERVHKPTTDHALQARANQNHCRWQIKINHCTDSNHCVIAPIAIIASLRLCSECSRYLLYSTHMAHCTMVCTAPTRGAENCWRLHNNTSSLWPC
jgi:hypothetical protein